MAQADIAGKRGAVSAPARGLGYFPAVDGLRALAVLTVMAFHLNETLLPGGYVGVDIFFVISGFVVTASVAHERYETLGALLSEFYARRMTRILPALIVCLIATSIGYCLFVPTAWLSATIDETGKWAFFGASNFTLAHSDNYFSPKAAFNPFTHTWSLGVEEQFYLLFPFLMFFGQGNGDKRAPWLVPLIVALCAASLIASAVLTKAHWEEAFYLLPSRYWELGLGMALCLTAERWKPWLERNAGAALAVGIGGVIAIVIATAVPTNVGFPFPWALLPAAGAAALISVAVAAPGALAVRVFAWAPIVFIGQISYSLYLWHWPIDVLLRWTTGLTTWISALIATGAAFALAIGTFYVIERPARRFRQQKRAPALAIVAVALIGTGAIAYGTTKLLHNKDLITLSVTRDTDSWHPSTIADRAGPCRLVQTDSNFGPARATTFAPQGCAAPASEGRLFVAGDSHALAYTRLLADYVRDSGRIAIIYSIPGCRFVGMLPEPLDTPCMAQQMKLAQMLGAEAKPHDVIFLPSLRTPRYADQSGAVRSNSDAGWGADAGKMRWTADGNAVALATALEAGGAEIVFEGPKPVFKAAAFRCADWFNEKNPDCVGMEIPRAELEARRAPALAEINKLMAQDPRASLWDPFDLLCPGQVCHAIENDKPRFFDGDHISGASNDLLYPSFRSAIDARFAAAK